MIARLTGAKGKPRLKKAIADAYSPSFGKTLDPDTEVTITTGANEGEKSLIGAIGAVIDDHRDVECFYGFYRARRRSHCFRTLL